MPPFSRNFGRGRRADSQLQADRARPFSTGSIGATAASTRRTRHATSPRIWPTYALRSRPISKGCATWDGWSIATAGRWCRLTCIISRWPPKTKMRQSSSRNFPDGRYTFVDHLDDGASIRVAIDIQGSEARIDFSGSADVLPNNLNANRAIVTAAVMYCLRSLIDEPIPLNQGVLAPIELIVPPGMLNPDRRGARRRLPGCGRRQRRNISAHRRCPAGSSGCRCGQSRDDEQRVVWQRPVWLLRNDLWRRRGNGRRDPGADAVHTHMTNTRLTDPEILEQNYPIRVRQFGIRPGSGGRRRSPRRLRRHSPARVPGTTRAFHSLATTRALSAVWPGRRPAGQAGRESSRRSAKPTTSLWSGRVHLQIKPGDVLTVATPGGGGYGSRLPGARVH